MFTSHARGMAMGSLTGHHMSESCGTFSLLFQTTADAFANKNRGYKANLILFYGLSQSSQYKKQKNRRNLRIVHATKARRSRMPRIIAVGAAKMIRHIALRPVPGSSARHTQGDVVMVTAGTVHSNAYLFLSTEAEESNGE